MREIGSCQLGVYTPVWELCRVPLLMRRWSKLTVHQAWYIPLMMISQMSVSQNFRKPNILLKARACFKITQCLRKFAEEGTCRTEKIISHKAHSVIFHQHREYFARNCVLSLCLVRRAMAKGAALKFSHNSLNNWTNLRWQRNAS